jgi:hypothetical protein
MKRCYTDFYHVYLRCDFYGPLKNGKYLFVLIDDHSRYPIAKFVSSTASKQVIDTRRDIRYIWRSEEIEKRQWSAFNSQELHGKPWS